MSLICDTYFLRTFGYGGALLIGNFGNGAQESRAQWLLTPNIYIIPLCQNLENPEHIFIKYIRQSIVLNQDFLHASLYVKASASKNCAFDGHLFGI